MLTLHRLVCNLERQCSLYTELETLLTEQQAALVARAADRVDAANQAQARLLDALAAEEAERRELAGALGEPGRSLQGLIAVAGEAPLRQRLERLLDSLPALVRRVSHLTRTNWLLATDAEASCRNFLRLLGADGGPGYLPAPQAGRTSGRWCRLDVVA